MKNNKLAYILELIWLVAGVFSIAVAIHSTVLNGIKPSLTKYILAFICFLMYIMRRNLRLNKPDK